MKERFVLPEGVRLEEFKFIFYQESDSCQEESDGQELTIETRDAGGGKYLVLETKRWAIDLDKVEEFCALLKQMVETAGE